MITHPLINQWACACHDNPEESPPTSQLCCINRTAEEKHLIYDKLDVSTASLAKYKSEQQDMLRQRFVIGQCMKRVFFLHPHNLLFVLYTYATKSPACT